MATASVISQAFEVSFNGQNETLESQCDRLLLANRNENKRTKNDNFLFSGDVLISLNYYLASLDNIDKVMFHYMSPEGRALQLRDLQITCMLLMAQKKYEQQHQKIENIKAYNKQLNKCKELIYEIQQGQIAQAEQTIHSPELGHVSEDSAVKYLSMFFGQWLAMKMVDTMDRKTKSIKDVVGAVNEKRLYWVWSSVLIKTIMELVPADYNIDEAKQAIRTPDRYTGTLSWGLYYFRFGLNLGLLLKHTITGPWMSDEESDIPWNERFKTQWAQRKFTLLNDSLWATCNIACFFWLNGARALGAWGDTYTIGLLLFDLTAAVWEFSEQESKYLAEMNDYTAKIQEVEAVTTATPEELVEKNLKLNAIKRAKKQCEKDWGYQKTSLRAAVFYAAGLCCSYIMLCSPFFPTGSFITAVNVAGAVICFVSSVMYNSLKGDLEVSKTKKGIEESDESYQEKINELRVLIRKNSNLEDNQKKFLFLELKKLQAETDHKKQTVILQNAHLLRSVLFESLIPTLIFVNLVFLPVSLNLSMVAAIVLLAAASYTIIDLTLKTEKKQLTAFDDGEYKKFCEDLSKNNTPLSSKDKFFQPSVEGTPAENPATNDSYFSPDTP